MTNEANFPRLRVDQVKEDLVVVFHNERTFAERLEQAKKVGRSVTTHWELAGMVGVLAIDLDERLIWLDDQMLASAKLEGDAAQLAVANLRRKTPTPLRTTKLHPDHAVFIIGEDDGLASGRILLHDLFAPLAKLVGQLIGDATLLVRVIQTGLVVCCPNTPGDMKFVDELIAHAEKEPGFVGGSWLAWVDNAWAEIEIDPS